MKVFEKVNPSHPDKLADRVAGAIVDLAYRKRKDATCAVEVMIGHCKCFIIVETNVEDIKKWEIQKIVNRIVGSIKCVIIIAKQDVLLQNNQAEQVKTGDNGIFKGMPLTKLERDLSYFARTIYNQNDGKYIMSDDELIICESNVSERDLTIYLKMSNDKQLQEIIKNRLIIINPLGDWTGGIDVDVGCTNRKLGSDMSQSATGGGLHGKDFSKADVSVNIYAFMLAQEMGEAQEFYCAIGKDYIYNAKTGEKVAYDMVVNHAKRYLAYFYDGSFEKFAEWGLV